MTTPEPMCPPDASSTLVAPDETAIVAGGCKNTANGAASAIIGGIRNNVVEADWASVVAGARNEAVSKWSSIVGGYNSVARSKFASVPGGSNNDAGGRYSSAFGKYSTVLADHAICMGFDSKACVANVTRTVEISTGLVTLNGVSLLGLINTIKGTYGRQLDADPGLQAQQVLDLQEQVDQQTAQLLRLQGTRLDNLQLRSRIDDIRTQLNKSPDN